MQIRLKNTSSFRGNQLTLVLAHLSIAKRPEAVARLSATDMARFEVWVDGVKIFTTTSSTLKTKLRVSPGVQNSPT